MTANEYQKCSAALSKAGWTCTGGMYPNSNAAGHMPVTWTGHFERKLDNGKVEQFWLTAATVGSRAFQTAIGLSDRDSKSLWVQTL